MMQPMRKNSEAEGNFMKVSIRGGSEGTDIYYYSTEPPAQSSLTNETILADLQKLMQLDSYEIRANSSEIVHLQAEVKQSSAALDKILSLCEDETKTSGEILQEIQVLLEQLLLK